MKTCGLKNERAAIRQMRESIKALRFIHMEWTETEKERDTEGKSKTERYKDATGKNHRRSIWVEHTYQGPIIGKVETVSGKPFLAAVFKDTDGRKYFKVSINRDFATGLAYSPVMPYFDDLCKIDTNKFPSAIPIAHRMLQHSNMNDGKPNQFILSIPKVLDAAALPKPDSHWRRDIVEPLENCMDELQRIGMIRAWEFCNKKKMTIPCGDFAEYTQMKEAYITWAPK